jgi:hypothetical protein
LQWHAAETHPPSQPGENRNERQRSNAPRRMKTRRGAESCNPIAQGEDARQWIVLNRSFGIVEFSGEPTAAVRQQNFRRFLIGFLTGGSPGNGCEQSRERGLTLQNGRARRTHARMLFDAGAGIFLQFAESVEHR